MLETINARGHALAIQVHGSNRVQSHDTAGSGPARNCTAFVNFVYN